MKKYNNIDEFFKEEVNEFKVTPSDKVWENIESEYFKARNTGKRNALILALVSLLLITGSIFTWTRLTDNAEPYSLDTNPEKEVVTTNSIAKTETKNEISTSHEPEINTMNEESIHITNNNKPVIQTNDLPADKEVNNEFVQPAGNQSKSNSYPVTDLKSGLNLTNANQLNKLKPKSIYEIESSPFYSLIDRPEQITIDEYIEKKRNLHFYTGASASMAIIYYSATTDQSTWTADLVYGLKLKRYYIETGIGFQKMKEHGNFQIEYLTNDSIGYYNQVLGFEINPDNPSEITYKTKTKTVYDSIEHHLLQSPLYYYNYIVLPVKFGYKFYQKPHFSISAETGIIYSYLTKTYAPEVQYNNPDSKLLGITNNTPERVEHNFRVHIALRLNYNITKTVSLSVQPEFTKFLNSIYKQSYSNKVKPYTMGIRFGVCFDF